MQAVRTCLMFVGDQHGRAREAVDFYVSIFPDGRLDRVETYGPADGEAEGTVVQIASCRNKLRNWELVLLCVLEYADRTLDRLDLRIAGLPFDVRRVNAPGSYLEPT